MNFLHLAFNKNIHVHVRLCFQILSDNLSRLSDFFKKKITFLVR